MGLWPWSLWLLWLLAVHGAVGRASAVCDSSCAAAAAPVCCKDGRSYWNTCVASCAGVAVEHDGYCKGDKVRFIQPQRSNTGATAAGAAPNWRLARESAAVIAPEVMSRFSGEGYVYRGRVALSSMPAYVKESSAAAQVSAHTQQADDVQLEQGANLVEVAVIRVDSSGNMYQKTYNYDPKRFPQTAYNPFDPSGGVGGSTTTLTGSPTTITTPAAPAAAAIIPLPATVGPPIIGRTTVQPPPPPPPPPAPKAPVLPPPTPAKVPAAPAAAAKTPAAATPAPAKAPAAAPPVPGPAKAPAAATPTPAKAPPAASPKPAAPAAAPKPPSSPPASSPNNQFAEVVNSATAAADPSAPAPIDYFSMVNPPPAAAAAAAGTASSSSAASPPSSSSNAGPASPRSSPLPDFFSMVDWAGNGAAGGEVLKPEMGSYGTEGSSSAGNATVAPASSPFPQQQPQQQPLMTNSSSGSAAVVVPVVISTPGTAGTSVDQLQGPGGVTTVTFVTEEGEEGGKDDAQQQLQQQHGEFENGAEAGAVAGCSEAEMTCSDTVTGLSRYFGTKTVASKYMDQIPMVGLGRVSGVTLFYNKTSGCMRGLQVNYNHISHPTSFYTSVLLGSAITTPPSIVVKALKLGPLEVVDRAEVYAPTCVQYLKLFTSRNNSVLVGRVDPGGEVYTPAKNRPNGMLVAVRGFQDKSVFKAATADRPATVNPGVLKQLQFVWGATQCNCSGVMEAGTLAAEPATAAVPQGAAASAAQLGAATPTVASVPKAPAAANLTTTPTSSSSKGGRRLAEVRSSSTVSRRLHKQRQRRLHQLWRRRQLSHAALEAEGLDAAAAAAAYISSRSGSSGSSSSRGGLGTLLANAGMGMDGNLPAYDGPSIHRMLSVIHPDSRQPCPVLTYPFKTLGQINAKATDGGFVCSGGLIGEDRVLTAGHCVWDDRDTQGPFQDLSFSPAQWKKDGKITAPLGQVDWDYVTLFEAYVNDPDGEGLAYDVAVITLKKPVGKDLGYLGIRADPSPCKAAPLALTLAGYPGDDPEYPIPGGWQGGCFYDTCTVNFSCSVSITNHTCDSYVGQSGAPMYDRQNFIRAVHTLGVLPGFSTSNGAITIQKFILDNVMGYWKDTTGFAPAAPGSIGSGSYY